MISLVSLLFVLWFLLKFKIHNFHLYFFVYFFCCKFMTNEPVDTASEGKKAPGIPYNIIAASRRTPRLNHWKVTLPFCFSYSHVSSLRTKDSSSKKSTKYECWSVVQKMWTCNFHYARSAILEAIHVRPRIDTSAVVKKGNRTQRKTKVSPWCMHCSYCRWRKGTSWAEAALNGKKNELIACWVEGIRQSVSQLVSQSVENFVK